MLFTAGVFEHQRTLGIEAQKAAFDTAGGAGQDDFRHGGSKNPFNCRFAAA